VITQSLSSPTRIPFLVTHLAVSAMDIELEA